MEVHQLRNKILFVFLALALVAVPVFTACAEPAPPVAKTLKIGSPFPLSGPAASWGLPISNMQTLVAERINAEGGIKVGGDTYYIELIPVDTKCTPEGSVAAAHKLVYDDKVKFMIGCIAPHESKPMQTITEPEKVVFLCGGGQNDVIGPDKPYAYRIYLGPGEKIPGLYLWFAEKYPAAKKVALVNSETGGGRVFAEYLETYLPDLGFEMVTTVYYEFGEKDFTPHATRVMTANPDVISPEGPVATEALFIKAIRDMGYKGMFVDMSPVDDKIFCDIAGKEYVEGYLTTVEVTSKGPIAPTAAKELKQAYIDKYGEWNSIALAGGFAYAPWVLKIAIESVGSLDTDEVKAVLDSGTTFDTPLGPVTFGGEEIYGIGHQVLYDVYIGQIQDGETTIVDKVPLETMMKYWALWPEELAGR